MDEEYLISGIVFANINSVGKKIYTAWLLSVLCHKWSAEHGETASHHAVSISIDILFTIFYSYKGRVLSIRHKVFIDIDSVKIGIKFRTKWENVCNIRRQRPSPFTEHNLTNITITAWEVSRLIKCLDPKKATDPDKIPNINPKLSRILVVIQPQIDGEILPKPVGSVKCMLGFQEHGHVIFLLPETETSVNFLKP